MMHIYNAIATVLLKGNVSLARNFIAINDCVLSLSSAYQACVFCLDFWLLVILFYLF